MLFAPYLIRQAGGSALPDQINNLQNKNVFAPAQSVCGRIRTFGALPHTTLAGWHHRPLGHANGKWMGQESNLRCFFVTDLQSAALATRHTHPWGDQGESNPHKQSHNLPDYHCPIATVAPVGLEPIISGLKGQRPNL